MIARARRSSWTMFVGSLIAIGLACLGLHWIVTVAALMLLIGVATLQPAMVAALVVLSIPIQSEVMLPFVRGELTVTQLVLFGLIPGWLVLFWKRRIWLDAVTVGFLLVMAAFTLSFVEVDSPSLWFQETYRWAVAGVFYLICRSVITSWRDIRLCVWMTAIGVIGVSVLSLMQYFDLGVRSDFVVGGAVRVYGTFGTPNTLAAYLEFTVPLLLAVVAASRFGRADRWFSQREQVVLLGTSVLGLAIIGLTQSRGGWLGIAIALLVLWIAIPGRVKYYILAVGSVLLVGFLMTPPGQSQVERFGKALADSESSSIELYAVSSYDTGTGRDALWGAARGMIADHPVTGVGAGEFDEHYREYAVSWLERFPRGQAHNVWLQMGAQSGLIGIAAYAVWYAASVWGTWTARWRTPSSAHRWFITGVLAIFAAYTVHSLVDYLNVLSLGLQLSAITAIALNLAPEPLTRYQSENNRIPLIPYPEHT